MKNPFSLFRSLLCLFGLLCLSALLTVPAKAQPVDQSEVVFEPSTDIRFTHQVRWQGVPGRLYVIQASTDLQTWLTAPVVEMGAGNTIIWGFTPSQRAFFRLKYTVSTNNTIGSDGDADGDGLTNGEEVVQYGTDPFVPDMDSDGISDFDEIAAGLNPKLADSNGNGISDLNEDSDGDGITNRWELANTSLIYTPDSDSDGRPDGDDWMETVDAEISASNQDTLYNQSNPNASYPTSTQRTAFRSQVSAALPAFNGVYENAAAQTILGPEAPGGPTITAFREYQLYDGGDRWVQLGKQKKSNLRLRTGHAAAGSASSAQAFPAAQQASVPVFVAYTAAKEDGTIVEQTGEVLSLTLSNGTAVPSAANLPPLPDAPDNLTPYTATDGTIHLLQKQTVQTNPVRLCVDTNMNGILEYRTDGRTPLEKRLGSQATASDADDVMDTLTAADPLRPVSLLKAGPAGLILDINNNNSDALTASPFANQYDYLSLDLDGPEDRAEFGTLHAQGTALTGHVGGSCQVRIAAGMIPLITSGNAQQKYILNLSNLAGTAVRVHRLTASGNTRILMLYFEPNAAGVPMTQPAVTIDGSWFSGATVQNGFAAINLLVEGVQYGSCVLNLEVFRISDGSSLVPPVTDTATVQVNVDQVPAQSLSTKDGQQLGNPDASGPGHAGTPSKHYAGVDFDTLVQVSPTANIRAVKGHIMLEIPAGAVGQNSWRPWETHKRGPLRQFTAGTDPVSTASFWIGLTGHAPGSQGQLQTWAQAGFLLSQRPGDDYPNKKDGYQASMYLETSRLAPFPSHTQDTPNEIQSEGVLSGWATSGINLEFVLFQNLTVNDPTNGSWVFVCKDIRTPTSPRYFRIKQQMPPPPDGATPAERTAIQNVYDSCLYRILQAKMEFHNSASFLFGNINHKALIEDVQYATVRGGSTAAPPINDATSLWAWVNGNSGAGASFNWTKANEFTDPTKATRITRNRGIRPFDDVRNNSKLSFWNIEKTTVGTKDQYWMWDDRTWAYPKLRH